MKRMIFGIALMACGAVGVLMLIFAALSASQHLGVVNGNSHVFVYLRWYGLTSFLYVFMFLGFAGMIVCVVEAYLNKG